MPSTSTTPTPINAFFQVFMLPVSSARLSDSLQSYYRVIRTIGSIRDRTRPPFPKRYSSPSIYLRSDEAQSSPAPMPKLRASDLIARRDFQIFEWPIAVNSTFQPPGGIIACGDVGSGRNNQDRW